MISRTLLRDRLERSVLVFDGAVGTLLMAESGLAGRPPEQFNLVTPETVEAVHARYVAAGAGLIQTNTFGATRVKLAAFGLAAETAKICHAAAAAARRAAGDNCLVAGCIGPTGALLEPFGDLTAAAAYAAFHEQAAALAAGGVDLLNIETMTDVLEAKLALVAARDAAPGLPVMVSVTFDRGLRTLTGTDPETAAAILRAAGADVIGTNCGTGPEDALEIIHRMHEACDLPLIVKPNAGMPSGIGAAAAHRLGPAEFARWVPRLIEAGASVVGGCCGTTPQHLREVARCAAGLVPVARGPVPGGSVASASRVVAFGPGLPARVIGERINPSRRPDLQQALRERDWAVLATEARRQTAAGADLVDVNVGYRLPGVSEADLMRNAVQAVQHACDSPISIDTRDIASMEAALQVIRGKPLLNSTAADQASLASVLGLAVRYGAAVIGLPLDGAGVPETAAARLPLIERIVDTAKALGLPASDLVIDGLTLTAGMHGRPALETLATVRLARERFGVSTVLGVSNVSHGLPRRDDLNVTFLAMALAEGLDLALINPLQAGALAAVRAADVLTGRDAGAKRYISFASDSGAEAGGPAPGASAPATGAAGASPSVALHRSVIEGDAQGSRRLAGELIAGGGAPLGIINEVIVPALEQIGREYEARRAFLPQLLLAAEAAHAAFDVMEPLLVRPGEGNADLAGFAGRGTVVLATVRGDMHDIGKNILSLLLRSHGFRVVDLGRDVAADRIVAAAAAERADVIGLSALMTTTMTEMATVSELLAKQGVSVPLIVGGAVLNPEYAGSIGAAYAPDAVSGVRRIAAMVAERRSAGRLGR